MKFIHVEINATKVSRNHFYKENYGKKSSKCHIKLNTKLK